ncbi:MAG: hypothetical protein H7177_15735 [Rhizobacter sp.]|nr:hypothetical protein [Bacteriovorax sp.]
MEKKFCALVFALTFVALSSVVHGSPSAMGRSPSVDPVVEVDIEDVKTPSHAGYNFETPQTEHVAERVPTIVPKRVPANIVAKSDATTAGSMVGPLIFLIALPIGLWIIVSKKFSKSSPDEKTVGYYPKTQQFRPYKTDYQKSAEDDDIDFPKAS